MSDKEKIRAEVKRRKYELHYLPFTDENLGKINAYEFVLKIIDSIPEEPVSEGLEDFAKEYSFNIPSDVFHDLPEEKQALWKREIENAIVVGAKWKEEQLLKDAVERKVKIDAGGYPYIDCDIDLWDYNKGIPLAMKGDKYKLILIKED